jgi:hypothetical protein
MPTTVSGLSMQQIVDALASVIRNASIPSVRSVTTRPISDGLRADLDVIGFGSRTLYLHVTDTEATPSAPSSMAEHGTHDGDGQGSRSGDARRRSRRAHHRRG